MPDWFDVLDMDNRPVLTEREILRNLQAILNDADKLPIHEVSSLVVRLFAALRAPADVATIRSPEILLAYFPLRTARFGRRCARDYRKTEPMNLVSKL